MTRIFFILILVSILALPVLVFAVEGEEEIQGLVPCGTQVNAKGEVTNPCTLCDLFVLIKKIMNFAALIAIPLAVGFMAYGGIRMAAAGGSTENLEKGRKAITSALIGIFLVFGAWLVIDLIMGNLLLKGGVFWPWNEFPQCEQPRAETGAPLASGIISGGALTSDANFYSDGVRTDTEGFRKLLEEHNKRPEGSSLRQNVRDVSTVCNSAISGYLSGANLNGVEEKRVRVVIQAESSGYPSALTTDNDAKSSYGLMQVRVGTARLYDRPGTKNLSDRLIGDKLLSDTNYNINIGTKYYADLLNKYKDPILAHAAYNGGPLANKDSVHCLGLRRWQCEFDNPEHTLLNERTGHPGYGPTRKYIENISKYYANTSC